ncbi:MAG: hypothetical protein ACRC5M_02745 [Anaeroplasmataceae bacterium]
MLLTIRENRHEDIKEFVQSWNIAKTSKKGVQVGIFDRFKRVVSFWTMDNENFEIFKSLVGDREI